ncbi:hypothetical protein LCGC14_0894740 [marine sediment metagenome]|uniref:Uncharacterized protein n=1 Tax=marine sediment metagenome TaxID=412755 RepID=A0A0F9P2Z6_9ZZZZ
MSRTISQIFDEIIVEKETFSSLSGLTSPVVPDTAQDMLTELTTASKVAIWRLIFWMIAVAIFVHESLFDVFKSDVEKRALEIVPATTRFYVIESKKFQLGDMLVFLNDKFQYSDTTSIAAIAKQIIKQASARDINQVVTIKIAKDDGAGGLEKLTTVEKTAFEAYLNQFKIAGTKTIVISDDPDILKTAYTIQFDPLVMKADGSLIEDGTFPVQEAIDGYIEGLPFDSTFRVQDQTDAIQAARGVVNAVADVVEAKFGTLSFSDILAVITETYLPNAGYLVTDPSPIVVLTPADYDSSLTYVIGDQVRFEGIVYEANVNIGVPEAFDPTKWDTISNLTFISI